MIIAVIETQIILKLIKISHRLTGRWVQIDLFAILSWLNFYLRNEYYQLANIKHSWE